MNWKRPEWMENRKRMLVRSEEEKWAEVQQLREELTPDERQLLVLRVEKELTWEAMAEALGLPGPGGVAEVRARFKRLEEKLAARARELGLLAP